MEEQFLITDELVEEIAPSPQKPRKRRWIVWVAVLAAIAVTAATAFALFAESRAYQKPLRNVAEQMNPQDIFSYYECAYGGGFYKKEARELVALLKEQFVTEEARDAWEEKTPFFVEEYGEDYEFYIDVLEKEELEEDSLELVKEKFYRMGKNLKLVCDELETLSTEERKAYAEEAGFSSSRYKKLVKLSRKIATKFRTAKVTKGYRVRYSIMVRSDESEGVEEYLHCTENVYKVNGTWVKTDGEIGRLWLLLGEEIYEEQSELERKAEMEEALKEGRTGSR